MSVLEEIVAGELPPPLWSDEDTPRARRSDPETSHAAADRSQTNLSELKRAVLELFESVDFGLTDSELDDLYAGKAASNGWPECRHETPRKRRSDLTPDFLVDSGERRPNRYGRAEVVWVALDAIHVNGRSRVLGGTS